MEAIEIEGRQFALEPDREINATCKCPEASHARHPFCSTLPIPAGFEQAEREGKIRRAFTGGRNRSWKWFAVSQEGGN